MGSLHGWRRIITRCRSGRSPSPVASTAGAHRVRSHRAIREFYEPAAAEAGIELAVIAPPRLMCRLDRTLFQRALGNLLTNAFTHTPQGGRVDVSASLDAGTLAITVSDTGVGIASEHL